MNLLAKIFLPFLLLAQSSTSFSKEPSQVNAEQFCVNLSNQLTQKSLIEFDNLINEGFSKQMIMDATQGGLRNMAEKIKLLKGKTKNSAYLDFYTTLMGIQHYLKTQDITKTRKHATIQCMGALLVLWLPSKKPDSNFDSINNEVEKLTTERIIVE